MHNWYTDSFVELQFSTSSSDIICPVVDYINIKRKAANPLHPLSSIKIQIEIAVFHNRKWCDTTEHKESIIITTDGLCKYYTSSYCCARTHTHARARATQIHTKTKYTVVPYNTNNAENAIISKHTKFKFATQLNENYNGHFRHCIITMIVIFVYEFGFIDTINCHLFQME